MDINMAVLHTSAMGTTLAPLRVVSVNFDSTVVFLQANYPDRNIVFIFNPSPVTSPWRWKQKGPPKLWYSTVTPHGVTNQKTLRKPPNTTKNKYLSNCEVSVRHDWVFAEWNNIWQNISSEFVSSNDSMWHTVTRHINQLQITYNQFTWT